MSAFIVNDNHVNVLVTAMQVRRATLYVGNNVYNMVNMAACQQVAEILMNENIRSVNYRYNDSEEFETIKFKLLSKGLRIKVGAILKGLDCLAYQSCETPDWEKTEAFKIIAAMKEVVLREVDGYDSAEWEIM